MSLASATLFLAATLAQVGGPDRPDAEIATPLPTETAIAWHDGVATFPSIPPASESVANSEPEQRNVYLQPLNEPLQVPAGQSNDQPQFEDLGGSGSIKPYSISEVPRPRRMDVSDISRERDRDDVRSITPAFTAVFREPAHFPVMGFTRGGEGIPYDLAVIYESMSVAVSEDGNYEVRLTVEAPRNPVVIHLQLALHKYTQDPQPAGTPAQVVAVPVGTVTLAPITLVPDDRISLYENSHTFTVRRTGYSEVLADIKSGDAASYTITRSGTARIGAVSE